LASTITIFENQLLKLPGDGRRAQREARLLRLRIGRSPAFETRSGRLFARQFAGAVDLGGVRVEILPKSYGVETIEQARTFLYNLLDCVGDEAAIGWIPGGSASSSSMDVLEVVERRAADELVRRVSATLPRRYQPVAEVSPVIRGRILFNQLARQSPVMRHHIPVVHCPLNVDNDLSRLLKALARFLWNRTRSVRLRRDLDACLDQLAAVQDFVLDASLVSRVQLGRYEADWAALVEYASLVVEGEVSDPTRTGETGQPSLLFPLNKLFERILRKVLANHLKPPHACRDRNQSFCLLKHGDDEALGVIPDIVIGAAKGRVVVADAKWKALSNAPPRFGVLPGDVYQILAYMRLMGTPKGVLLYPRLEWMTEGWNRTFNVSSDGDESITVVAADIDRLVSPVRSTRLEARERFAQFIASLVG